MASKALSNPLIRFVALIIQGNYGLQNRGYAVAASAHAAPKEAKVQQKTLPNGIFVAALDNGSPVTRVTVAFKAGSRYEASTEPGISHVLRAAAGLSTGKSSGFLIARKLAQVGASVTASGDREFLYYTLESTQDNLEAALEYLTHMISCQEFRPWELDTITKRLKYDIAALPPQIRAVDLLHKAAYRRGLGNSLFVSPKRIGAFSSESLQHYTGTNIVPSKCAITVVGDNQDTAALLASSLALKESGANTPAQPTKYHAGDMRKEMGGELTHVALAVQGAASGKAESLALAVAAKALGNGPVTKWGSDNSVLAKAIGNIGPFAAAGFNVSYSDSGLFGAVLSVPKDEVSAAVKAVRDVLQKASLPADVIKAAKNQLKLQVLSEAETGTTLSESMAAQGLYSGTAKTPADTAAAIDALTEADVCAALSKAATSKVSMGAVGNLSFCPYVDEI